MYTIFLPLIIAFICLSVKEIYFDILAYTSDRKENSKKAYSFSCLRYMYDDKIREKISMQYKKESESEIFNSMDLEKINLIQEIEYQKIEVGQIIILTKNQESPADLLILDTTD